MESLLPLSLFAFVSSITPGPNNIMLTSSGIRFGFMRCIPHMLGVVSGFGVMLALYAAGIGSLIVAMPVLHIILKTIGSAYLVYLAWQLRSMAFSRSDDDNGHPMSFIGAALFQFANPKAWVMAVTGASAFLPPMQPIWFAIAVFCLLFSVINLPCLSIWAATGAILRRYLTQPKWRRLFCAIMIILTLYSAVAVWS
ncbi:LysE family translocator [Herminiimonas fonticola]|uniref:Threonine/homoserine/homoserine lactone efflux protein n=1 Tax=Herminiimonas fonticola TaxID=303380 RepID=A0A4R6G5H9_9BURK|nr:LysE family translocator [Herminiimonas fonticola]RBA23680.1 putative threonine efflux protein [Herminiimonas fonticola]TDN89682.1 threonine/homoserine/homoserine lactone efflux protein [Herminiimonas fonticola]